MPTAAVLSPAAVGVFVGRCTPPRPDVHSQCRGLIPRGRGRRFRAATPTTVRPQDNPIMDATPSSLTLLRLRELYLEHARRYYRRRDGNPSGEHVNVEAALDSFIAHAGERFPAARLNRHIVKAWMDQLATDKLSRAYINGCLSRVRRWIRWAC